MEQKLLFFDIDGTLITEEGGEMPDSTREAVRKAKEQGHLLFINTGRTKASLPTKILELGFDGYVCGCGSTVILKEEQLFTSRLTNEQCKEVARKVREYGAQVFYEASDAVYFDYESPEADKWIEEAQKLFHIKGRDIEEVLNSDTKIYDKFFLILEATQKRQELLEYLRENFVCIDRGPNMYEVIQKGYSKATGIQFLCDYMGKNVEDCYVFGDSENDRAMLEAVPNSIAMGNAVETIKETCSYVTDSVLEDGIYKAMEYFGLIK